jgi:hypothetical protein
MQAYANDALQFGSFHYEEWSETYEALRVAAWLIGATAARLRSLKIPPKE